MTRIYANTQPLHTRWGHFRPQGETVIIGSKSHLLENPVLEEYDETLAARLIVGLNRLGQPPATVDQLVAVVRRVRTEQVGDPSSSFLLQRGIYQHRSGEIVEEPGAQVIIIDTTGATQKAFGEQMVVLAESIASDLSQESVIVEIQKNGVTQRTLSVGP